MVLFFICMSSTESWYCLQMTVLKTSPYPTYLKYHFHYLFITRVKQVHFLAYFALLLPAWALCRFDYQSPNLLTHHITHLFSCPVDCLPCRNVKLHKKEDLLAFLRYPSQVSRTVCSYNRHSINIYWRHDDMCAIIGLPKQECCMLHYLYFL